MRCGESDAVEPASFVYVIGAATARGYRTYVGWTLDPDRRLSQHNGGIGAKSTRGLFWELLYIEKFASRAEAMSREWHLKQDRKFRKLLTGNAVLTAPR
jgi:putative endonuclease